METVTDFIFLGSRVTADSDCSHEIKRHLLLGRKAMINLEVKWSEVRVTQLCPTLCDPMEYTIHGILQAIILEWIAFPFSRVSFQPRDQIQLSCIGGRFFSSWATRKAQEYWSGLPIPSPALSSQHRNLTGLSCIVGGFFTNWAISEVPYREHIKKQRHLLTSSPSRWTF